MSYTEGDYIDLTNLAKLRVAKGLLRDVTPHGFVALGLVDVALRTVARLVVFLESQLAEAQGRDGEWPEGPCSKGLCSLRDGHEGECGL